MLGRIVKVLTDNSREEYFGEEGEKRKIVISIFYPADNHCGSNCKRTYSELYAPASGEFINYFVKKGVEVEHLRELKTNVLNDAPIALEKEKCPVVIYSPGFGSYKDDCSYNAEKLVEQGYIVISTGHPYDAIHTIFPDGTIIRQHKTLQEQAIPDKNLMKKLIQIRKEDIIFVINSLHLLNSQDSMFKNTLDLNKIGLLGHSLGGGAVFETAFEDQRIKAAVMLDCALHRISSTKRRQNGEFSEVPFLNFRREEASYRLRIRKFVDEQAHILNPPAFKDRLLLEEALARKVEEKQEALYDILKGYKSFIKLRGAAHMTFTDYPVILNRAMEKQVLSVHRAHEIIKDVTARFFNEFLLGIEGCYSNFINSKDSYYELCSIDRLGEEII